MAVGRGQNAPESEKGDREGEDDGRSGCLLYTSDAADERSSVDLGGRRIIKKKKTTSDVDRLGAQEATPRTQ